LLKDLIRIERFHSEASNIKLLTCRVAVMFAANGVISRRAWGNAPGFQSYRPVSAESATQSIADETRFQR
jgi:hypothetical protein